MKKSIYTILICFFSLTIKSQIPLDHLQLNFPFNNNVFDVSGNNLNGVLSGATITTDRFDNPNKAYYFNGSDAYIQVPNSPIIKPEFPFSISLWLKIDSFSSVSTLVYASDETENIYSGFWIGYLPSGEVSAGYGDGLGQGAGHRVTKHSEFLLNTTDWHNIIVSFNDLNDIDVYIDCTKYTGHYSGSASNMTNLGSDGVVGRDLGHHANSYHHGKIDDIRIYDKSLTDVEIDQLCNEPNSVLAINEFNDEILLNVYPNPATAEINIKINSFSNLLIKAYNSMGQLILKKELNDQITTIKTNDWATGLYFLQIIDQNGVLVKSSKVLLK